MESNNIFMELEKFYWQNFLLYYEEKFGELLYLKTLSKTSIMAKETDKFIAFKTNIPEQYFVLREFIIGTPWEKYIKTNCH